jgi:hypothetical protein
MAMRPELAASPMSVPQRAAPPCPGHGNGATPGQGNGPASNQGNGATPGQGNGFAPLELCGGLAR